MPGSLLTSLGPKSGSPINCPYYLPSLHFSLLYIKLRDWMVTSKGTSNSGSVIKYGRSIIRGDTWELLEATA